ncbi:MAG: ectonucleotide pyrophosphatase/phosphodiesterase [Acidobacteriota bacterium]
MSRLQLIPLAIWMFCAISTNGLSQSQHVVLITVDGLAAYYLFDSRLEIPNLRELSQQGVWAESSETVFPSLTHPSHTTLTTGVTPRLHGVLGNAMWNRETRQRFHVTNKKRADSVKVPTLFDLVKERGLTTAAFFWPETNQDASIDYNLPELLDPDGHAEKSPAAVGFAEELTREGIPIDLFFRYHGDTQLSMAGDAVLAEAAAYTLRKHRPHFLAIHFVSTDKVQHPYGSNHYLSWAAITHADRLIGLLRRAVAEAGMAEQTTFVVGADHGFHSVYDEMNLYPLFREEGLADRVTLYPDQWVLHVERKPGLNQTELDRLNRLLSRAARLPGIARVLTSEEYGTLGLPSYDEDPHVRGQYMIVANIDLHLVVDPTSDSMVPRPKSRPYHGHGYLPSHPRMYPALVLAGRGIAKGRQIGHVRNLDVAPTIAYLLGLPHQNMSGRLLQEALAGPSSGTRVTGERQPEDIGSPTGENRK